MKLKKRLISVTFLFLISLNFCMHLAGQEISLEKNIRFAMWASMEAFPGIEASPALNEVTSLPVNKIMTTAPFILSGMLYGWNFDYTPYDKKRKVDEFFDFTAVRELSESEKSKINYASPWIKDQRLNVWIEYERSDIQVMLFNSWQSVKHPNIKGIGYAPLSDGFEGIQKACSEALKQAVREFERSQIKNKPKEITGKALLSKPPLIGIDAGRYMVTLDFFMQSDRIIEYKTF